MARDASPPVQWWDRGRARWRSRPEQKALSYQEPVGGRRRPAREVFSARDPSVRGALARYCVDRDEDALDRALARASAPRPALRWRHSSPRATRLANAARRRAIAFGRGLHRASDRRPPSACLRFDAYLSADYALRCEIERALVEAALAQRAAPARGRRPLREHPSLLRWIPARGLRAKIALRLLRWAFARQTPTDRARRALRSLLATRALRDERADRHRSRAWLAMRLADCLGLLPDGYAGQHSHARSRWIVSPIERALLEDRSLRDELARWITLNLPAPRAADAMVAALRERHARR